MGNQQTRDVWGSIAALERDGNGEEVERNMEWFLSVGCMGANSHPTYELRGKDTERLRVRAWRKLIQANLNYHNEKYNSI